MDYEKMFKSAVDAGKMEEVSVIPFNFITEGQTLIGRLLSRKVHHFDETDSDCMEYTIDTDAGKVSTILGALVDQKAELKDGEIYAVTYKGKTALSASRSARIYQVMHIEE